MRYEVKVGKLANGIKFYSQYDCSGSTNVAGIGIKCGSIHAPPGRIGLPHLVEHLIARESLKYPSSDIELIFERYLGDPDEDINIRIDRVSTFFGFLELLKKQNMMVCLDVMAHFMRDKIVTSEGIDVEKAAIHNEYYLRGADSAPDLVDDLVHQLMYQRNPAGFRIDCNVDDLKKITRSQIRQFIKKHYVPSNMFLIMLGPKFEEARDWAKRNLADLEGGKRPNLNYDNSDDLPVLTSIKSTEVVKDLGQYHLAIGFPTENYFSKDAEVLEVISRILAFRLRAKLREGNREFDKGVYRVSVCTSRSFIHGLIYATFATCSREFVDYGEATILAELKRLRNDFADSQVLDAILARLDSSYLEAFRKDASSLSEMIIEAVCNGDEDLERLHTFRDRLRKVTRRKLIEVANKYFGDNYVRVMVGP